MAQLPGVKGAGSGVERVGGRLALGGGASGSGYSEHAVARLRKANAMTREPLDALDTEPNLLEGWTGEPMFALFFIPSLVPLGFSRGSTYTVEEDFSLPWLEDVDLHITVGTPLLPRPQGRKRNSVVSIRIGRNRVRTDSYLWQVDAAYQACSCIFGKSRKGSTGFGIATDRDVTVFELVVPFRAMTDDGAVSLELTLDDAFDRGLHALNELLLAYSVATGNWRVRQVSRRTLAPILPWGIRRPEDQRPTGPSVYIANGGNPLDDEGLPDISDTEAARIGAALARVRQAGDFRDPAIAAAENARRAQHAIYVNGDYSTAALWAYAWIESLLLGMCFVMEWEKSSQPADTAVLYRKGLVNLAASYFHPSLGGSWDPSLTDSVLGRWNSEVVRLRHKIVHDAYRASEREAVRSLEACEAMEAFCKDRIGRKRHDFPYLAVLFLGEEGLDRRNLWSAKIRKQVEAMPERKTWIRELLAFSDKAKRIAFQ